MAKEFKSTRQSVIEGIARCAFAMAWADEQEEKAQRDEPHENLSGCDIYEVAPRPNPKYAYDYAKRVCEQIEKQNAPLDDMYFQAQEKGYDKDAENFGSALILSAQGQGAGWKVDYNDPAFVLPLVDSLEYEGDE